MPSVKEVIHKIKEAGLEVRLNPSAGSHTKWDVIDPSTGTILTGIARNAGKQGNDPNWHYSVRRILKRAGFNIEFGEKKKSKNRATGEIMGEQKATAQAFEMTVTRLRAMLEDRNEELVERAKQRLVRAGKSPSFGGRSGKGARAEFVRTSMEVAEEQEMRAFKSEDSGQQTLHQLLEKGQGGMSLWSAQLLNATMDELDKSPPLTTEEVLAAAREMDATPPQEEAIEASDGDNVLSRAELVELDDVPEDDALLSMIGELELKLNALDERIAKMEDSPTPAENGAIRADYASILLDLLGAYKPEQSDKSLQMILQRLDRLAELER